MLWPKADIKITFFIYVKNEFCVNASERVRVTTKQKIPEVTKQVPDQLLNEKKSFLLYCEIFFVHIYHWLLITIPNEVSFNLWPFTGMRHLVLRARGR